MTKKSEKPNYQPVDVVECAIRIYELPKDYEFYTNTAARRQQDRSIDFNVYVGARRNIFPYFDQAVDELFMLSAMLGKIKIRYGRGEGCNQTVAEKTIETIDDFLILRPDGKDGRLGFLDSRCRKRKSDAKKFHMDATVFLSYTQMFDDLGKEDKVLERWKMPVIYGEPGVCGLVFRNGQKKSGVYDCRRQLSPMIPGR
jgi:hypothetical protein